MRGSCKNDAEKSKTEDVEGGSPPPSPEIIFSMQIVVPERLAEFHKTNPNDHRMRLE